MEGAINVVTFFEKNKDNAYTTCEIAEALGLQTPKASEWLISILLKLERCVLSARFYKNMPRQRY